MFQQPVFEFLPADSNFTGDSFMHDGRTTKDLGKVLGSERDVAVEKIACEVEE